MIFRKMKMSYTVRSLTRQKRNGDTVRYSDPQTGDLILDIRPDFKTRDGKVATLYDTQGYPCAVLTLLTLKLGIEGYRETEPSPPGPFDAVEKVTLFRRRPAAPSAQDRQNLDRLRTLRLKFARQAKDTMGFSPEMTLGDTRSALPPEPDRIETRATFKFKLPTVAFGQEKAAPETYALENRLSA